MRFEQYLNVSSTLLILTGFSAILAAGTEYIGAVTLGIAVTIAYGFLRERLPGILRIPRGVWNVAAVLYFLYLLHDTLAGSQDLVGNGIKFVIYLQIVKILSPKTNRDHMQIYLLSFLHVVTSTVLSSDITFAIPFLAYVVLATWTWSLFNLKLQLEESASPERRKAALHALLTSNHIVTRRFLWTIAALSISIVSFTMVVFFLFPRLSMGQFLRRATTRQTMPGFADQVELGTIGTIKSNSAIAMRVEISPDLSSVIDFDRLYWRGTASDRFDGRVWRQSHPGRAQMGVDIETGVVTMANRPVPGSRLISYRVFLEAHNPAVILAADRAYRITWNKTFLERLYRRALGMEYDDYGGLYFIGGGTFTSDLTYEAESFVGDIDPSLLRDVEMDPSGVDPRYLRLPAFHPQVESLLRSVPLPDERPYSKAVALTDWLERNYRYTLDVQDVGVDDPLFHFLLVSRHGHCEYFSTVLAMALRVHGIPSRNVVGFRGGEFNAYGSYLAVRQNHAHSWVEAHFPRFGWIPLDPSPLDSTVSSPSTFLLPLYQFTDFLRLRWNKYIIEYDLRAQAEAAERIGRRFMGLMRSKRVEAERGDEWRRETLGTALKHLGKSSGLPILVIIALLLAGSFVWNRRRDRATPGGRFKEILVLLLKHGYSRAPGETLEELSSRVRRGNEPIPHLTTLTSMYYAHRFGGHKIPHSPWAREKALLRQALRHGPKGGVPSRP